MLVNFILSHKNKFLYIIQIDSYAELLILISHIPIDEFVVPRNSEYHYLPMA